MKANIVNNKKEFHPVTIEITLESIEEVKTLWGMTVELNQVYFDRLKDLAKKDRDSPLNGVTFVTSVCLWEALNDILEDLEDE